MFLWNEKDRRKVAEILTTQIRVLIAGIHWTDSDDHTNNLWALERVGHREFRHGNSLLVVRQSSRRRRNIEKWYAIFSFFLNMVNLMFKKKERERHSQDDDGSVFLLIGNVPPRKSLVPPAYRFPHFLFSCSFCFNSVFLSRIANSW